MERTIIQTRLAASPGIGDESGNFDTFELFIPAGANPAGQIVHPFENGVLPPAETASLDLSTGPNLADVFAAGSPDTLALATSDLPHLGNAADIFDPEFSAPTLRSGTVDTNAPPIELLWLDRLDTGASLNPTQPSLPARPSDESFDWIDVHADMSGSTAPDSSFPSAATGPNGPIQVTTTGSDAPLVTIGQILPADDDDDGPVTPQSDTSMQLISLDDFQADIRFSGVDGSGFAAVILDTGIDLDHEFFGPDNDFDGIADRIVYQYDFADGDGDASDQNDHGTNVSSIIASSDSEYGGIAPGADIIHLKVFSDSGSGSFGYVEQALQWVVANTAAYNIASVNMSLGDGANHGTSQTLYGIADEIAALAALDVITVSASGNKFYQVNSLQGVQYPAADPNSLSVGAVYDADGSGYNYADGAKSYDTLPDAITPFSQRDADLTDIFAPGAPITGAGKDGGLVTMHGTSQASPHIAGIAVLAQQLATDTLGRRLTVQEFTDLLKNTGVTINDGDDEDDNVDNTGLDFGRVDVHALGEAILGMVETTVFYEIAAAEATKPEGDTDFTGFTFTITRTGDTTVASEVNFAVAGNGTNGADAADFGGALPAGTLSFAANEISKVLTINVSGDLKAEADEGFTVTLSQPSPGSGVTTPTATATIINDDQPGTIVEVRVAASSDDAEEKASGSMSLSSSDLELIDDRGDQTVGIRFAGIEIPQGAIIVNAYLQFQVDEKDSKATNLEIRGEATDDAQTFSSNAFDITSRSVTSASADWSPPDWNSVGEAGADQQTSDLTEIIQEIVDREGWTPSNAMAFVISGSGKRVAESFDGKASAAPLLHIEYQEAPAAATTYAIAASDAANPEGDAGSTPFTFTVTRSGDTSAAGEVDYTVSGGSADAADFGGTLPSGTVSFAAGETSQTLTINVSGDSGVEADEAFTVTLSNPSPGSAITTASANGTIVNDDTALSIAATDAAKTEGDGSTTPFTFTVTRSGDVSGTTDVAYAVSGSGPDAADDLDFGGALPAGNVHFAAGETSKTITIDVTGDTDTEADEGFTVTLSGPSGGATIATASADGTIENDDVPPPSTFHAIAAADASKAEGDIGTTPFTFTVTRSGDTTVASQVSYAVTGGTADATDFGGALPSGTVDFAAGELSKNISIDVSGDGHVETDEAFTVTLSAPSAGSDITTASAHGTILNDDVPSAEPTVIEVRVAATSDDAEEKESGSVSLSSSDLEMVDDRGPQTVGLRFAGIEIPQGAIIVNAHLQFQVDESDAGVANLEIRGEAADNAQTFSSTAFDITSRDVTSASANWSPPDWNSVGDAGVEQQTSDLSAIIQEIVDRDGWSPANAMAFVISGEGKRVAESFDGKAGAAPLLHIEYEEAPAAATTYAIAALDADNPEGDAGAAAFTFMVTRSGDTSAAGEIDFAVTGSGADAADAADFGGALPSGKVSFDANETSKILTIDIAGDSDVEADEGFTVTLSNAPAGSAITTASADGTIENDDAPPPPATFHSIAATDATKAEGDSGTTPFTFTVTRSGETSVGSQVSYTVTGGGAEASDFGGSLPAGILEFAADEISKVIAIDVSGDSAVETDEAFTVTLSAPSPGSDILTASDTGTIVNDDVPSAEPTVFEVRVSASSDDAEEKESGSVSLSSSDLELIDDRGDQTVGIRFAGVDIPQGVVIVNAYLQFQVDESDAGDVNLEIRGEAIDDAPTFSSTAHNITSRSVTSASANWSPPDWDSVGEAGADQRTTDLTSIVQEIIDREGWSPTNAMAFVISGSGKRVAESFDGKSAAAPLLHIEYQDAPAPTSYAIAAETAETPEGDTGTTPITFTVTRSGDTSGASEIEYAVTGSGEDAADAADFGGALPAGTLSFAAGEISKTLTIEVSGDNDVEASEGFTVTLSPVSPNSVIQTPSATVTIENDDEAPAAPAPEMTTTIDVRVSSGSDDAEENASGATSLNSSDIELVADGGPQTVGLRFTDVDIPQGATIVEAYLWFQVDEKSTGNATLEIWGEATPDAETFSTDLFDISSRALTSASVVWTPPNWMTVGENGPDQQTPDLTAVVQEIVNQNDWTPSNALAFMIGGSGKRVAESYEGNADAAPVLHVEYETPELSDIDLLF